MNPRQKRYRRLGHRMVSGWLEPEVLDIVNALDEVQRHQGIGGAVAEIGVHHGKLFLALHLLQQPGERSVAIDLFDDQHRNVDKSGRGDLGRFRANVALWSDPTGVVVHEGDSTELTPEALREQAGGAVRLFSVDGGHVESIVLSDLWLAERALADGGVVIADDVFNQHWPGVAVGTLRYLDAGGLVPFLIGFNKVFLTQPGHAPVYRGQVAARLGGAPRLLLVDSEYAGHDVTLLVRQTVPGMLARRNGARRLHRGLLDGVAGATRWVAGRKRSAR